jgi:peptidoglycan/xylan/chitin deacetylase (PgdA/CDA1 family)
MRAVLTYHSIDDSASPISVSPAVFNSHVAWLSKGGVRVVRLDQLAAAPDDERGSVAITFDDAFANIDGPVHTLRERGLPVTVFVVTAHVGRTNAWGGRIDARVPDLPLLDWDALAALRDVGASIGAHSRTHPALSRLSNVALDDELGGCREDLRRELGSRADDFAYPYGDVNDHVAYASSKYYRRAYSTVLDATRDSDDPMRIPRLDMYYWRTPGAVERWGQRAFARRLAWCRATRAAGAFLRHWTGPGT